MSSHVSRCFLILASVVGIAHGISAEPAAGDDEATSAPPGEAERIEQLRAIGYLGDPRQAPGSQGVTLYDARRAANGLNLLTSGHAPVALLMDMHGVVLHEWRAEFEDVFPDHPRLKRAKPRRNYWRDVRLLSDGGIVVIWELFGIFKLDRDSHVVWVVPEPAHHALQLTETGEIVHLQAERRMIRGIPNKRAIEDLIVVRDSGGRELRRLAISDALRNVHWRRLREAFWARSRARGYGLDEKSIYDPFHTNSLWLLSPDEAARLGDSFHAGDALVSMAMLDTIAILDLDKGRTRWSQQGPFGMQHEPRPTLDGGIVLFNNFVEAKRSSVLTLDPRTRRVTREYTGPRTAPLYSRRSGRVQVLANGNILVVETEGGRALEIAADGETVWEFHSPFRTDESEDGVAGLYSLQRVAPGQTSWLDAGAKDAVDRLNFVLTTTRRSGRGSLPWSRRRRSRARTSRGRPRRHRPRRSRAARSASRR